MPAIRQDRLRSLRIWVPVLLCPLAVSGGLLFYFIELRIRERRFETEFVKDASLQTAGIQAHVERWVQRNDLDMVQSVFAEQGLIPEVKAGVFLDATNLVLAATQREWIGRPLRADCLGVSFDSVRLSQAIESARETRRGTAFLNRDRSAVITCFPASLPLKPGQLGTQLGGAILVSYDLTWQQTRNLNELRADIGIFFGCVVAIALALAASLHFLITRRVARLKATMTDFAAGKAVAAAPSRLNDEIAQLIRRFNEMAAIIRKDIDERGEMERSLRKSAGEIQDLYEHAPCGYHSMDATGRIVRMNDTELSWLGYAREEVVGNLTFAELLTPSGQDLFRRKIGAPAKDGSVIDMDLELKRKDGSTVPVLLTATSVADSRSKSFGWRVVVQDISERKRAEEEIRRFNADLERRVRVRTQQLEDTHNELISFSYSMSHDLRTPLRSIDGFSRMLLEDCGDKLDERSKEHLEIIRAASQRMGQLIDDMVKLLQINRTEIHWSDVNLSALAEQVAAAFKERDPRRQTVFTIASGCVARGDPGLLRIAMEDIFSNSWKYTSEKPQARIEFGTALTESGPAYFVQDNGCGFDMRYVHKLFGAFQRLHSDSRFPGTGIGLACVHRVIQRHGGQVWIEGKVDEGATVYFTLPGNASAKQP